MSTPVQRVCEYLTRYCRDRTLATALHVGKHVVKNLLDDDASKLGSEDQKHPSIRELSALLAEERVLSPTTLWRYLGVYALFVRKQLFGKISDYGMVWPLVGLPHAVQDRLLADAAADGWKAPRMKVEADAERAPRKGVAPAALAARQLKRSVALVSGLADLPAAERVSRVKQLEPLVKELLARWTALTGAVAKTATPVVESPVVEAPRVEAPDMAALAAAALAALGASPSDPTHVLTESPASAKQARAAFPLTAVNDAAWTLAGLPAPDQDDVPAYFAGRAALLGEHDTIWAVEAALPPQVAAFLDRADRLDLRYGPGLAAQLDLCVAAQLVLARPVIAARTSVLWGGTVVPLAEVAPVLADVWRAFHADTPAPWDDLRRRDLPPDLAAAVLDWLSELPHPRHGLGATQHALLLAARERGRVREVLVAVGLERASVFRPQVVERMTAGLCAAGALEGLPEPVTYVGRRPVEVEEALSGALRLTDLGAGLLADRGDLLPTEDRWWGGTHLTGASPWRWDPDAQVLIGR